MITLPIGLRLLPVGMGHGGDTADQQTTKGIQLFSAGIPPAGFNTQTGVGVNGIQLLAAADIIDTYQ